MVKMAVAAVVAAVKQELMPQRKALYAKAASLNLQAERHDWVSSKPKYLWLQK